MIYIECGSEDVYRNFGLEYYFAAEKRLPDTVFLFWRTTPTLMIGRYQNLAEEVRTDLAEKKGIRLVRRMSGGGTIYTDAGGWQFTFISPDGGENGGEIAFERYLTPVLETLQSLGINAVSTGRNDITVDGKKISGNAQYRLGGVTVHHGSLLFDSDLAEMAAVTTVDEYKIISKSIKSVRDRVTNIREHLPPEHASMTAEEFKTRMVDGILLRCGGGAEYRLSPEDSARISEIAEEKFASREALYGRNPRFEKEKTGRFPGGKVCVSLKVEQNRIADADLSGDFFAVCPKEELQAAIIGCPYDRAAVLARLRERFPSSPIHGVTLEELAETIV